MGRGGGLTDWIDDSVVCGAEALVVVVVVNDDKEMKQKKAFGTACTYSAARGMKKRCNG